MAHRILVVDDDPHIREVICFALEKAGMQTQAAPDGAKALSLMAARAPDLVVLDIGMPEMDGLETCRRIRRTSETPILFLSARDEEVDRILGLEMGGDDYVTKPFSPRELVARVNAILKRARPATQPEPARVLEHGSLRLDPAARDLTFRGMPVAVTALEFAILGAMMPRPRQVLSREQIMSAAYAGTVHVSDRTVDSHVRNIRAKLALVGCTDAIETVHGVGFRLGACTGRP
jgi:two-component system OmpR family response regulator